MTEKQDTRRSSDANHGRARYDIFDHMNDYNGEERRTTSELMRRIDGQDELLLQIRDMVVSHVENEKQQIKAIEELVIVWRGSKIIIPALAAILGLLGSLYLWAKDHIK